MNPQPTDKSKAKILMVDDKLENLRLLTVILKEAGYSVPAVASRKNGAGIGVQHPPRSDSAGYPNAEN